MNIFDATLKIKKFKYKDLSFLRLNNEMMLSSSLLSLLYSRKKINNLNDFFNKTKFIGLTKGIHNLENEKIVSIRYLNDNILNLNDFIENSPNEINTKEYWNFLHKEFKYCDVMTYPIEANLKNYFATKQPLYESIINKFDNKLKFFENKKILEIGPGYGILPKLLKENNIKSDYYCADIVKRFKHKNFIDIDGYSLLKYINQNFDIIFMSDVFQHLGIDIINTYFTEFKKLLNIDGSLIFTTPTLSKNDLLNTAFFAQTYILPSENLFHKLLNSLNFNFIKENIFSKNYKWAEFYIVKNNI